jgi:hypothetical protein
MDNINISNIPDARSNSSSSSSCDIANTIHLDTTEVLNSVRHYVQDQSKIESDKVMPYLFMLARGVHKDVPKVIDLATIAPFNKALELNVLKRRPISMSKKMVIQELSRRNATNKLNANNKKFEELFDMLHENPLDGDDKDFVISSVSEYLKEIASAVKDADDKKRFSGGRAEVTDRLRWMLTIDLCDEIREAYLKVQDVLTRQELDARNSDSAGKDFHDLVAAKFNDETWVPQTSAKPDLHSFFLSPIQCEKREYFSLTKEKSKSLLLDYKHKLNEICKRYELSGNGAGQLDSDGEELAQDDDRQFGRVDMALARMKGGDDRSSFLRHEPIDLLYFWDIMDHHDLIHFTTAQLRGSNSVTSDSRPCLTSYQSPSNDSYDILSRDTSSKRVKHTSSNDTVSSKMVDNVSRVGLSINLMNEQQTLREINGLKHEKHKLMNEWRKEKKTIDYNSEDDGSFYKEAIADIDKSIEASQKYLDKITKDM